MKSIRKRISFTLAATVFACTYLTVIAFLISDFRQSVHAERMRLENTASVFAAVLSAPVRAGNPEAARDALRGIKNIAHVNHIAVHLNDGTLLAEMGGGAILNSMTGLVSDLTFTNLLTLKSIDVEVPVREGGQAVARLSMNADIDWIRADFKRRLSAALLLALIGISIAYWLAMRHVAAITDPLSDLARSFADIGGRSDLSQRIVRKSDDEVGILVDAFNEMIDRIDERDSILKEHRDGLLKTVAQRTSDLLIAKEDAERANAAKSEFLAMVGHEIRTPMNGMMVMAEMLAAAPLSPRHLRYAEIINRSGRNLLTIINDILDMSKIEAGRLDLESAPFSIDSLIDDVAGLFSERAREKQLSLTFVIDPQVPLLVLGDVTRLNQVITNLVNNALKFTEAGGVVVGVSARAGSAGSVPLTFTVTDTGIGIASDKLEHVFERFAQGDQTITRRFGGTGLGLAISKRLVEAMNGAISVTSREGIGSTFTVNVALPVERPAASGASFAGRRFAVLHDEQIHFGALKQAFEGMHAVVLDARSVRRGGKIDALLATDDGLASFGLMPKVPVFRLVPRSGVTRGADRLEHVRLEFPYPARRAELAALAAAFVEDDFAQFSPAALAVSASVLLPEFPGLDVLVVDDNPVNCEVLCEALLQMGAKTTLASNGLLALEILRKRRFDIVFMDCSMPVMDGFAATRQWRTEETGARLPIIALTAYSEALAGEDWKSAGMDGFMTKPFTIPAIAEVIAASSGRKSSTAPGSGNVSPVVLAARDIELLDPQTLAMIDLLSRKGGPQIGARIFGLFLQHGAEGFANLKDAVLNGADEDIKPLAHALKSMCSSAGAARMAFLSGEMEALVGASQTSQSQLIEAMETTLAKTITALQEKMRAGETAGGDTSPSRVVVR